MPAPAVCGRDRHVYLLFILCQNSQLQTTINLGAAYCRPGKNDQKKEFLKKADDALYRAKNEGRNQVVFHPPTGKNPAPRDLKPGQGIVFEKRF
ncbi:MAG: GGDEF domain-containing protein [Desulfobacteraceae bacterium]|nr:GGDEF domain-containing protein [Desulfobacteraceae bacterium]